MTARALVLESPRHLVEREVAVPSVSSDDAVLRVEACGLCGTDHEQYTGQLFPGRPFVPGHETVGVIESIGEVAANAGTWPSATGWPWACSCRAGRVRAALTVILGVARSTALRRCTASRASRSGRACGAATRRISTCRPTRCCSRFRRRSIPFSRRCSTRSVPASAGARSCPVRKRATSWPCSDRACAACRRRPRPRKPAPRSSW